MDCHAAKYQATATHGEGRSQGMTCTFGHDISDSALTAPTSTTHKLSVIFNLIFLQLYVSSIVSDSLCFCDFHRPALYVSLPPLDMLGGLAMRTRRSLDPRDPIFILCYVPLPLDMLGGLALPI
jgi:hypothetical protein